MPLYNAGHAYLQILPSFRGIEKAMQRETRKLAAEIDKSIAQGANDGLLRAFRAVDVSKVARSAQATGDKWASTFEASIGRRLKEAAESLPEFEPKVKLSRFDRAIEQTKRQLSDLATAKIGPDGDIGLDQLGNRLDQMVKRMVRLADETKNLDQRMRLLSTAGQADMLKGLVDEVRAQGLTDGRAYGGSFATGAKRTIEAALRDLPEINLKADASPAERAVAALRVQLEELDDKKIGVDIDRDRFEEELGYVGAQLESLARDPQSFTLRYDLEEAGRTLRQFTDKVRRDQVQELGDGGEQAGEQFAGRYADTVRRRLTGALASIPNIEMTVDNSDAERKLAAIRVKMQELADKTIGVDIDATTAQATIAALVARLELLDSKDVDVDVRTNAAAAAAELELIDDGASRASQSLTQLGRESGITMSRIGYLIAIGASIGSVIAPAAATAAVAVAGLGVTAGAALLGFGALGLGLAGVADAVQKIDKYQQDADKSARSFQQAQDRVNDALRGVRDAEENLTVARENADRAAENAQRRIADARRAVTNAVRDAAEAVRNARENEADAERALVRAREDAREALRRAADAERDAERNLTRANQDQAEARRDLNQALKDAVDDLRDLDTAVRRNGNEIDKATTASMKAKQELDKILTNPRATEIERRMARETYEDRLIQIEELKSKGTELREEQDRLNKEGVEGTERVKRAREGVADADERAAQAARRLEEAQRKRSQEQVDAARSVAEAQNRVAKSHAAVQRAQRDGAERVASAQRDLADAQRDAAISQRDSQRSVAKAQQQVADSQRALARAYTDAGTAGGEAFDNMRDSLNELSPAGQAFAQFIYDLKPALQDLRKEAQEGLLPGLQDGLQTLIDEYLPGFKGFVGEISKAMGDMFAATAEILTMPEWKQFFRFIDREAVPSLQGLWATAMNLALGIANIVEELHPLSKPMGQGLLDLSERFARWSENLENETGFQDFMEYAARVGPKVVNLIEQMAEFFGRLIIAAAPLGEVVVDAVTAVLEFINSWDIGTLTAVVDTVAVLATGILLLTGFVRGIKFATEVWTAASTLATTAQNLLAGAVNRYRVATVGATTQTGLLNGALFGSRAAGLAGSVGLTAMSAAAGPLGVALGVLGIAWFAAEQSQKDAKEATDELGPALQELGQAYRDLGSAVGSNTQQIEASLRRITSTNTDMQNAVVLLTNMGLSVGDIAAGAAGGAEDLDKVIGTINSRIAELLVQIEKAHNAADENGIDVDAATDEIAVLEQMRDKFKENASAAKLSHDALTILDKTTQRLTDTTHLLTPAERALAEAHQVLADKSSTAEQKAQALTRAQDAMRESQIEAVEAEENWEASLDQLTDSVNAAKDAHQKGATSLNIHTSQGRANRDMVQNLITANNRMYDAETAVNGVTQTAINKGKDHVKQIREVARQLGLNKTETEKLITTYSKIPKDVETSIYFKKGQFDKLFKELEMAAYIQKAIREGKDIDTARHEYKTMISDRNRAGNKYWATGGAIDGPGIVGGKTEDANLIWASRGEFMQPAAAVDFYGEGFMEAVRRREIPKGVFGGYATGGLIGGKHTWPYPMDVAKAWIPTIEDLQAMAFGVASGQLGNITGGRGFGWQMSVLRKVFPGLALYSGFRPGSRTANGSLSWHARDGGRAVDIPPRMDVFNWIRAHYGAATRELIWGGAPNANIRNGNPHRYSDTLLYQHGPYKGRPGPSPHIHWAYDTGGMLPPGYSTVFNGTGRPEAVLTSQQWRDIQVLAGGGPRGNSYHFEFRDTTLDAGYLRSIQDREAVTGRAGRAR